MSNRRINETIGIRYDDLAKMKSIIDDVNILLSNNSQHQFQKQKYILKVSLLPPAIFLYMLLPNKGVGRISCDKTRYFTQSSRNY